MDEKALAERGAQNVQTPNNLPPRPPSLIERDAEIQRVSSALLDPNIPSVSIVGDGGMRGVGKTALALETAYRLLDENAFPGGVCWLNCRDTDSDLEAVLRTLHKTFDLVPIPSPIEATRRYLASHSCLLIFDNYEAVEQSMEILAFVIGLPERTKALIVSKVDIQFRGVAIRLEAPTDSQMSTLLSFIKTDTWDASRRVVDTHPELLTPAAVQLFDQLIEDARSRGDDNAVRVFDEHRALLARCREAGIARAFAEKILGPEGLGRAEANGLTPERAVEMARTAREMPPALREVLAERANRAGNPLCGRPGNAWPAGPICGRNWRPPRRTVAVDSTFHRSFPGISGRPKKPSNATGVRITRPR
ncbi:ATP-binding protein [Candidatus Amarolinea dominans]|uniref:ATP-binding protein n=1 Tax=Candidatus Amarolinea dominans TaxID=3140696 RepID=UPI0031CC6BDE